MKSLRLLFALIATLALVFAAPLRAEEKITLAAAADLKFAMDDIVAQFKKANPQAGVDIIYGSSGKFHTQLQQGAPFDLYFSADIALPRALAAAGLAASSVKPYAIGRLVLWSASRDASRDASRMTLADLADPSIRKIAIANPKHAPYGKRAEEALRAAGVWDKVEPKLVYGENIAQTALYAQTGNADIGIIALSLALNQELAAKGAYRLIDDKLHQPLEQGFIVTQRAAGNALARRFADFMDGKDARAIMVRYGFVLPGEKPGN
jgi:molybdate transport system substrate-binding protein